MGVLALCGWQVPCHHRFPLWLCPLWLRQSTPGPPCLTCLQTPAQVLKHLDGKCWAELWGERPVCGWWKRLPGGCSATSARGGPQEGQERGYFPTSNFIYWKSLCSPAMTERPQGPLVWIKQMGSWSSCLVVPRVHTALTGSLNSDALRVSCCGGFDCSTVSKSFCSSFSFLYYRNRFGEMDKEHWCRKMWNKWGGINMTMTLQMCLRTIVSDRTLGSFVHYVYPVQQGYLVNSKSHC